MLLHTEKISEFVHVKTCIVYIHKMSEECERVILKTSKGT